MKDANISTVFHCTPLPLKSTWKTSNQNCCNSQLSRKKTQPIIQYSQNIFRVYSSTEVATHDFTDKLRK